MKYYTRRGLGIGYSLKNELEVVLCFIWQNGETDENASPPNVSWKPPKPVDKTVFTPQSLQRNATIRRSLQRRVSMKVLRKKMKKFQDYSLPCDSNFQYLNHLALSYKSQFCRTCNDDEVRFSSLILSTLFEGDWVTIH